HGPYSADGSAPAPYAIWGFDAKYRRNKLQLAGLASQHLRRDYVYWLDSVIRDEFLQSSNVTFPTNIGDAADFVAGGNKKYTLSQFMNARKTLSDREWQKFPNGRYVCIVPTDFNTQMLEDLDYQELSKSHPEKNQLYGYISSVQDIDFFESTTLKSYAPASTLEGQTVATDVTLEEAIMVGPGAVGFGTAIADQTGVI